MGGGCIVKIAPNIGFIWYDAVVDQHKYIIHNTKIYTQKNTKNKRLTADADVIFVYKFLFYLFPEIFNSFAEYDIVGEYIPSEPTHFPLLHQTPHHRNQ